MKYVRYETANNVVSYGTLENNTITRIDGDLYGDWQHAAETIALDRVRLLSPCLSSKILGVGLNYVEHIKEVGKELPKNPLVFVLPSTSIIGPDDVIVHPKRYERVDFEGEIGVVIKKKCRNVTKAEAKDYILGYTCSNDVSCRDVTWGEKHWSRGKGMDTFSPIGPIITDEIDPMNVMLQTRLNGEVKQRSSTSDMLFDIATLVEFVSASFTLLPGDIIQTGTPSGIAPMKDGDIVEVEIEGIGVLRNRVVMEK